MAKSNCDRVMTDERKNSKKNCVHSGESGIQNCGKKHANGCS